jgi:CheY-like chemotaxis protein
MHSLGKLGQVACGGAVLNSWGSVNLLKSQGTRAFPRVHSWFRELDFNGSGGSQSVSGRPMISVVICDDEKELAQTMAESLGMEKDLHIRTFTGGTSLLDGLPPGAGADVLLLDIRMPGMNGLATLDKLRETWSPLETAVIMVTAEGDSAAIKTAARLVVSGYVVKPYVEAQLIERIRHAVPSEVSPARIKDIAGKCLLADPMLLAQLPPGQLGANAMSAYPIKSGGESWAIVLAPGTQPRKIPTLTPIELAQSVVAFRKLKTGWARAWPRRTLRPTSGKGPGNMGSGDLDDLLNKI